MNVLIIPSWYPSKGMPVNGIFFQDQAIALSRYGHKVTLIDVSFFGRKDTFNPLNFRFNHKEDRGVQVYSFKMPSFYILSRFSLTFLWIFKLLLRILFNKLTKKGNSFDIIHAHSFYPAGYCACFLSKKYGIPLIVTEHNTNVLEKQLSNYEKKLLKYTLTNCKKFICVSSNLKKSVIELTNYDNNLIVVPNMFSSDFLYNPLIKTDESKIKFLSIGSFNERKRHRFTISCFESAFQGISNVQFEIVGRGELFNDLQNQISKNGTPKLIKLLGSLSRKALVQKVQECDIFVLASSFENFGVVYIEAMSCGKPVIATKNGGANDIVNETNGILIDVDNREQLIDAMLYMYNNVHKYNPLQIVLNCYEQYSEESVMKKLTEIYNDIIKE